MELTGIIGLIVIIFDIWAITRIVSSNATVGVKILWSVLIIVLPVVGLLIWFVAGPK